MCIHAQMTQKMSRSGPTATAKRDTRSTSRPSKPVMLKLESICLNEGTQTRAHIDENTVAEYAEAMVRGDQFPPVVVFENDGKFILADGFHRHRAARRAKLTHILAEVRDGGHQDALKFALGANHKHGLRRTNADKRRAVEMALAEFSNLSDRLLAQMCGVTQPFVSNLRHQLITIISSTPRLGKDGKRRTMPERGNTTPSSIPDFGRNSLDRNDGNGAFMEIADELASLEESVEKLVDDHPDQRAAVVAMIGKVRSDLLLLENRVKNGNQP